MKKYALLRFLILFSILLPGCSRIKSAASDQAAAQAVKNFFQALHLAEYDTAVELYGGSYTILENYNPDLDPENRSRLWQRACQQNGFVCLPIKEIVRIESKSTDELEVTATFQDKNGNLFVRSDCCAGSDAKNAQQTVFTFQVAENKQGDCQVLDLPVYQP